MHPRRVLGPANVLTAPGNLSTRSGCHWEEAFIRCVNLEKAEMMKHFVIGLRMTGFLLWSVFVPSAAAQIGPDVVVKLEEFAHNSRVGPIGQGVIGAGMGTTSCNKGD